MPGKFACLLMLFCFSVLTNYAQKNLKEAIVVFNNADSTKGYIDYKEWFNNPSFILFTADKTAPTRRYGVNDLSYFEVTGIEQYKRYTVQVSLDKESVSDAGDKDTSSEIRVVFLKILQSGKNVALYSYRDRLKTRLYILDRDETVPGELTNSAYMLNDQVKEERLYRAMLLDKASKYLPGDAVIISQINSAGYYSDVIGDICLKLNGIEKSTIAISGRTRRRSGFRLFAGAGINRGTLKMNGSNIFSGRSSDPFYSPVATLGADLAINPAVGKLVLRGQFQVTGYKTDAYLFKDFDQYTEEYFFKFRQVNIAFEPQLLYNLYNKKNLKWFVSGGVGLNFSSYPLNERRFLRTSSTNSESTDHDYVKGLKNFWLNGCFTTGVDFNRIGLVFLFFPPGSITQTPGYGLDNSSLQLRMVYYLKKN